MASSSSTTSTRALTVPWCTPLLRVCCEVGPGWSIPRNARFPGGSKVRPRQWPDRCPMVRDSRHPEKERNPMRKSLAPIAITAAIAGGAGALAFGPAFAGAQTDPSASSDGTTEDDATTERVGPLEEAL